MKINDKLTITPQVSWKEENPWTYTGNVSQEYLEGWTMKSYRTLGNVTSLYKPSDAVALTAGIEGNLDKAVKLSDEYSFDFNGKPKVSYNNIATFAELALKKNGANLVLGARYDNHSIFGDAFVTFMLILTS